MENFIIPLAIINIILLANLIEIIKNVNWYKETEDLRDVFKAVLRHFHNKVV
jgi:hypothetical protein